MKFFGGKNACVVALVALIGTQAVTIETSVESETDAPAQAAALVEQQLGDMMSASNSNLAHAEHHHEHVVKKLRKQVEKQLGDEAKKLGGAVGDYVQDLTAANDELSHVIDAAKATMAEEQKKSQSGKAVDFWQDPSFLEGAKLSAKIGAAQHTLLKLQHRRDRAAHQAETQVEAPLEDESGALSMKLGDLTDLLETATKSLESRVDEVVATPPKANATAASAKGDAKKADDSLAKIQAAEKSLVDQTKKTQDAAAAANKKVNLIAKQAQVDMDNMTSTVKKGLEKAKAKEMAKVHSMPQPQVLTSAAKLANATKKVAAPAKAAPNKTAAPIKAAAPSKKDAAPSKAAAPSKVQKAVADSHQHQHK